MHGMPVDYVHKHERAPGHRYYLATLEYGEGTHDYDPFSLPRGVNVPEDFYLHPVIRRYDDTGMDMVNRAFLSDDLDNDWRLDPAHQSRLADYFEKELLR
jgi:hypothetical protein